MTVTSLGKWAISNYVRAYTVEGGGGYTPKGVIAQPKPGCLVSPEQRGETA